MHPIGANHFHMLLYMLEIAHADHSAGFGLNGKALRVAVVP
jgi:hypothetical protein